MSELINKLNPPQQDAVTTTEGALLILAGAGSGKTRVLTHRIAYILEQKLCGPESILAVTFTNKAAGEMKERIAALLNQNGASIPWCGTFHSICVRILRREAQNLGYENNFTIYDSNDSLDTVKEAMDRLMISKKDFNPHAIKNAISSAKNELITSKDFGQIAQGYFQQTVAQIYPVYQQILKENQSLDFDDLIMVTTQLFSSYPQILSKYQRIFKYIHVDEYQDTNHAQYFLIKQLTTQNICVVGDDDQSIYGFRGANIQNILNFENDFPNAKVVKLEQNYRSTQTILDASHFIVKANSGRRDKKLWTDNGEGNKIEIYKANDEINEAKWVVERINGLIEDSIHPSEVAVLYRTNAQSRTLEEEFIREGLPYKIVGSIRFYERKEIKDIMAYLRVIANNSDSLSLQRIINVPRRGIGAKTVEALLKTARSLNQTPLQFLVNETESLENAKVKNFSLLIRNLIKGLGEFSMSEYIKFLLETTKYIDSLDDGTMESQSRIENLKEFISVSTRYDNLGKAMDAIGQLLEDVTLIEDQSTKSEESNNSVTLMTIHASKGLEFEHVFVVGMEEMLFPHSRAYTDPKEMEEERRLAYVAITRAKKNVYATHTESRLYFGKVGSNPISRFLEEIPEGLRDHTFDYAASSHVSSSDFVDHLWRDDYSQEPVEINYGPGDKVRHQIFGNGKIVDLNEQTVVVDFGPGKGKKELAVEYANLMKL